MNEIKDTHIAIGAILVLETIALMLGYNGQLLAASIGIIAGLAGYQAGRSVASKRTK